MATLGKTQSLADRQEKRKLTKDTKGLSLFQKTLINAAMTGNDSALAFAQLYEVPLLQTWGVPVALVSLYPIVAGPLAVLFLQVIGHLTDKGANHRQKKMAAVFINTFVFLSGISLMIFANLLRLSEMDANPHRGDTGTDNVSSPGNIFASTTTEFIYNSDEANLVNVTPTATISPSTFDIYNNVVSQGTPSIKPSVSQNTSGTDLDASSDVLDLFSLPTTAVIGMIGCILFGIGYDCNISSIRSCVLACSPRQDHTSLLALALVMAALGGCITCVCGLVDLSPILLAGDGEKSLPAQTTVQLIICTVLIIIGMISTIVMSRYSISRFNEEGYLPLTEESDQGASLYGAMGNPKKTNTANGSASSKDTEDTTSSDMSNDGDEDSGDRDSPQNIPGISAKGGLSPDKPRGLSEPLDLHQEGRTTSQSTCTCFTSLQRLWRRCKPSERTLNIVIVCLSLYFGSSILYSYNVYVSDFLGKVLFGGDPAAPAGSPELKAYEDGVGVASSGLLVVFVSYLILSTLQDRILALLGAKFSFCLANVLMAVSIMILTFSEELATYYVACVVYGFHRTTLFTVPFLLANRYSQEKAGSGAVGVGKAMAVMTCMIPLNYCTIYLLSGPLIELTGYDALPLIVASGFAVLAAVIFSLHGIF